VTSDELLSRMNVGSVFKVATHNRLRWFGHVERKSDDDWLQKCQQLVVKDNSYVEGEVGKHN